MFLCFVEYYACFYYNVNVSSKIDKYKDFGNMNDMHSNTLINLGLTRPEAETFSAILKYPEGTTVLELSRNLNLPRPTIYSHLEEMLRIGIVKKGIKENTSLFYPETKEIIERIFEEKIKDLSLHKKAFSETFKNLGASTKFKPAFFVYEGPEAYENVWRDILRTRAETFWIWPIKNMLGSVSTEKLEGFHRERIKRGIWMNVLWPEKDKINIKKSPFLLSDKEDVSLRRIKILPRGFDQDLGYGIYGNKVAFISSGNENYAFVIESRELAQTLKKQFDFFWRVSKKYS